MTHTADVRLTRKQRAVLEALGPREGITTRALADAMETPAFRTARFSYDEVYGQLVALERKGMAQRERRPGARAQHWKVTDAGHAEIAHRPVAA